MMQHDKEVNVNWLRVNVPSVATMLVTGIGVAMYVQALASTVSKIEESRKDRSAAVDRSLDDIKDQLKPLINLPYRINIVEQNLVQTNQRMDVYLQTIGNKIDNISDRVGGLSTKVEVLSQKIDSMNSDRKAEVPSSFTIK